MYIYACIYIYIFIYKYTYYIYITSFTLKPPVSNARPQLSPLTWPWAWSIWPREWQWLYLHSHCPHVWGDKRAYALATKTLENGILNIPSENGYPPVMDVGNPLQKGISKWKSSTNKRIKENSHGFSIRHVWLPIQRLAMRPHSCHLWGHCVTKHFSHKSSDVIVWVDCWKPETA